MRLMRSVLLGLVVVVFASVIFAVRAAARDAYILIRGDKSAVTLYTASDIPLPRAESARRKYGNNFLWLLRSGREYVIRDQATLDRIDALFAPQRALEPEQEAINDEESEVDRHIDEITDRDDDDAPLSANEEKRLRELEQRAREIRSRERELDRRSDELERRAEKDLWRIADDAIRTGVAVRQ